MPKIKRLLTLSVLGVGAVVLGFRFSLKWNDAAKLQSSLQSCADEKGRPYSHGAVAQFAAEVYRCSNGTWSVVREQPSAPTGRAADAAANRSGLLPPNRVRGSADSTDGVARQRSLSSARSAAAPPIGAAADRSSAGVEKGTGSVGRKEAAVPPPRLCFDEAGRPYSQGALRLSLESRQRCEAGKWITVK